MIQRIQSLFLFICGLGFFSLMKLPFAESSATASPFFEDSLFNIHDNIILLVLCMAGAVLALINIFLFKNRILQLRIGYIVIICALFLPIAAAWLFFTQSANIAEQVTVSDGVGLYIPAICLIMSILANRFISKDQNLVKSMDRLR